MKIRIFFIFILCLLFSCEKEEDGSQDPNATYFRCVIGGNEFEDLNPQASLSLSNDLLTIDVSDNTYTLSTKIYFFSTRNQGDTVFFSIANMAVLNDGSSLFSNEYDQPYGTLILTDLDEDKMSGTFSFKVYDSNGVKINISNGEFQNITY